MPLTINIRDTDTGNITPYTVPDYEELTLAHWKRFNHLDSTPRDDMGQLDWQLAKIAAYTGLTDAQCDKLNTQVARSILQHVERELLKAMKGSEAFQKALTEGTDYIPPETITVGGKVFRVPYDLETETTWGQFADWDRWDAPEHEADIIAETLAFMLVEDGKEYEGTPKEKVALMMGVPMQTGFDLCAFFFKQSEQFETVTNQRFHKFDTSMRLLLTTTLKTSESDTRALTFSSQPQQ